MIPPFVDAAWVRRHAAGTILADVRLYLDGRSGREAYERGHLPGAVYVELHDVLAGPASDRDGRHPLPTPERFADGLSAAGIGDEDTVVAYDDEGGVFAARLVWMLRVTGHEAAVLDGGLSRWEGALESGPAALPAREVSFTPRPWPAERIATIDELARSEALLVDARDPSRFEGSETETIDPRSGHIPTARNLPARANIDPRTGRLRGEDELRRQFAEVGVDGSRDVIAYCGSGITACHDLLVMETLGLPPARLFPGSWSQWSRDPERPIETGPGR